MTFEIGKRVERVFLCPDALGGPYPTEGAMKSLLCNCVKNNQPYRCGVCRGPTEFVVKKEEEGGGS